MSGNALVSLPKLHWSADARKGLRASPRVQINDASVRPTNHNVLRRRVDYGVRHYLVKYTFLRYSSSNRQNLPSQSAYRWR